MLNEKIGTSKKGLSMFKRFKEWYYEVEFFHYYDGCDSEEQTLPWLREQYPRTHFGIWMLLSIWWDVSRALCVWICERRGHYLEDCSTAGPDSGSIDLECKRCGYTYHHSLY